jgi:VWFA-related protein
MQRMTQFWIVAGAAAVFAVAVGAQQGAQEPTEPSFRYQVNIVMAPTTVLDKDGNYVLGIKPHEFRLYDNRKLQEIKVDETVAPISLVVALQANHKVEAVLPRVQKIGVLLQNLVAGESGEVAVLAFDHRIRNMTEGFTNDVDRINAALMKIRPGSMQSALTDAVMESGRLLRNRPKDNRRVLLLITESLDQGSENRVREALVNLEQSNVMVYALNISRLYTSLTAKPTYPRPDSIPPTARHVPAGGLNTPTEVERLYGHGGYTANFAPLIQEIFRATKAIFVPNPVEVYTKYTGGKEFPFVSQEDLERSVQAVASEVHNQYLITYNPNNKEEGGYHELKVEVTRPGLEVRTRPGYWLAAVQ